LVDEQRSGGKMKLEFWMGEIYRRIYLSGGSLGKISGIVGYCGKRIEEMCCISTIPKAWSSDSRESVVSFFEENN
jgi:hypothetical protein